MCRCGGIVRMTTKLQYLFGIHGLQKDMYLLDVLLFPTLRSQNLVRYTV
jgi:hypothetical protein